MPATNKHQPWPMKWILVAIILIIVPYTFLTLRYRKPGPAFQPYEDMKIRANVSRLLEAGYQRISIPAQQPADGGLPRGGAEVAASNGGLPTDLRSTLVEAPLLPAEIISVTAAPVANTLQPYAVQFTCTLPDNQQHLSGAELFFRGETVVIIPTFERVSGDLQTRVRETAVLLTVPAGALKSGVYTVTLVGEQASRTWPLEVK
jgi:hypothetical protein